MRGRIGRGSHQSTCVLLYQAPWSDDARERLFAMIREAAVRPVKRVATKPSKAQKRERLEGKKHGLNRRLFDRLGRKVVLTDAGHELLNHAQAILAVQSGRADGYVTNVLSCLRILTESPQVFGEIVVPTPQITPDMILLASGYAPVQPLIALAHNARGELPLPKENEETSGVLWSRLRGGPYMPTPLIHNQRLYVLANNGVLTCHDLATGKVQFRQRVSEGSSNAYTASPITANGHLYCVSEDGRTTVVAMDAKGTIVARNALGESVLASPAMARGRLLIRGEKHLFSIAKP